MRELDLHVVDADVDFSETMTSSFNVVAVEANRFATLEERSAVAGRKEPDLAMELLEVLEAPKCVRRGMRNQLLLDLVRDLGFGGLLLPSIDSSIDVEVVMRSHFGSTQPIGARKPQNLGVDVV